MKRVITIVIEQEVPEKSQPYIKQLSEPENIEQTKDDIIEVVETEMTGGDGNVTVDIKIITPATEEDFDDMVCKKCNRFLHGGYCLSCDR